MSANPIKVSLSDTTKAVADIFKASAVQDPHIQKVISFLTSQGMDLKDILKSLGDEQAMQNQRAKKSPILSSTMAKNAIEGTLFEMLETLPEVGATPFRGRNSGGMYIDQLYKFVIADNPGFFPLRNFVNLKQLRGYPNLVVLPSASFPKYNTVKTACITPDADIVLNDKFCQRLINYAFITGQVPTKKKYVSNGGPIPDDFAPIEFLLVHEFYHYLYGDFYFGKLYPEFTPKEINIAGDLRSNYLLVKHGYSQLPIGLFSADINYDKQKTFRQMLQLVHDELQKLDPEESEFQDSDEHTDGTGQPRPNSNGKGTKGEGKGGGGGEEGEGEGGGEGEDEDGDGGSKPKEKKPADSGVGSEGDPNLTEENAEKAAKAVGQQEARESSSNEIKPPGVSKAQRPTPIYKPRGFDLNAPAAKYKWRTLLSRMIALATGEPETTYSKIHRSAITRMKIAVDNGMGAIKPGERTNPSIKLALLVDSSGSMSGVIAKVYSELRKLLQSSELSDTSALLYRFSDQFDLHTFKVKTGAAQKLNLQHKPEGSNNISVLFKEHYGGGTVIGNELETDVLKSMKSGYNLLLVTDTDIVGEDNLQHLLRFLKLYRRQLFVILDSRNSFDKVFTVLSKHGISAMPSTFSYFE